MKVIQTVKHTELYLMHCGNLNGKEVQKGGDICMHMADPFCCAVQWRLTQYWKATILQ